MKNLSAFEEKENCDGSFDNEQLFQEIEKLRILTKYLPINKKLSEIKISNSFSKIFPIKENMLDIITDSIKNNGFDENFPIFLWSKTGEIIDGHTRFQASKNAGISEMPVILMEFNNENSIRNYMYALQFKRRNISVPERLTFLVDYLNTHTKPISAKEWIAKLFGVSTGTAAKYLRLAESPKSVEFQNIISEKITLNKAYENLLKKSDTLRQYQEETHELFDISIEEFFKKIQKFPQKKRDDYLTCSQELILSLSVSHLLSQKTSKHILKYIYSILNPNTENFTNNTKSFDS